MKKKKAVLKVSGDKGRAKALAAAIAGKLETGTEDFALEAVGAYAVNNAVKAVAIANTLLRQNGELYWAGFTPEFIKRVDSKGEEFTLMRMHIYRRAKNAN